ncbi:MAG TPA: SRPBCC family protein [Chloroflexota bacterium]
MRVELTETVDRPIDQVFAFLSAPEKHEAWVGPVVRDSHQSEGPVHEGTTFHEEVKFLGRRLGGDWTVTRYEPPHAYEQETSIGKANMRIAFTLTPQGNSTRIDMVTEGDTTGIFKLADSVVARVLRNQQQADLDNLKLILESGVEAAVSPS